MLVHLHRVVHVQQVTIAHADGSQLLCGGEAEAQVRPGVARYFIVCAAQQHGGHPKRSADVLQCLQQSSPKALVPAHSLTPSDAACQAKFMKLKPRCAQVLRVASSSVLQSSMVGTRIARQMSSSACSNARDQSPGSSAQSTECQQARAGRLLCHGLCYTAAARWACCSAYVLHSLRQSIVTDLFLHSAWPSTSKSCLSEASCVLAQLTCSFAAAAALLPTMLSNTSG